MNAVEVRIGTRGSRLALAQARLVEEAFARQGCPTRMVVIETEGDRRAPDTAWGEGAFVAAIERALLARRVDVAVHSAKDVPTDEDRRLRIAAYLPRADPRDALVVRANAHGRRLDDLPAGARVGTDSPRRTGFLLARRPDLAVHPLHGNVDTRLRRLDEAETDALILACAGLDRIGLADRIAERLPPDVVPPAPGQGAIAVQVRRDDEPTRGLAAAIDDPDTRRAVEAERSFLRASGGGCRAPIGALATTVGEELELLGGHVDPDGSAPVVLRRRGPTTAPEELGRELATGLDRERRPSPNADRLDREERRTPSPRVLVTRASDQAGELATALRNAGLEPVAVPTIAIELEPPGGDLDEVARRLHAYHWVVVTSANGARAILGAAERAGGDVRRPSWAAIGPATARVLDSAGVAVDLEPRASNRVALAAELPVAARDRVLVVRGDLADEELAVGLGARGADVDDVIGYRTREAPESSRALLGHAFRAGPIDAVVFTSGSTVRGLVSLGQHESVDVRAIPAVCIGSETADVARRAGFRILALSPTPGADALANATAAALELQPQETS